MAMVNDFDKIEKGFWSEFKDIKATLTKILDNQEKLSKRIEVMARKHNKLAEACREGFVQTRNAATCLREELGEASGTLIESTWGT